MTDAPKPAPAGDMPPRIVNRCPHCGAVNPLLGWNLSGGPLPGIGMLEWFTVSCAKCTKILTVVMVNFMPAPELLAARARAIAEAEKRAAPGTVQ